MFATCGEAREATGAKASVVFVPPKFAKSAVVEAVEAGIELIVVITEGIPVADSAYFVELALKKGVRIIGPNCPGLITLGNPGVNLGIIPGGGTAFVRCIKTLDDIKPADDDELAGLNIVRRALEEPLRLIAGNAGHEGSVVVEKVREGKDGFGFNAATGEYEDLIKAGVIDPKKVARIALQNAASVASLLLTTECAIAEKPEPKKDMPAMPDMGGMGGMGGMY